jgi:hypothetical protein
MSLDSTALSWVQDADTLVFGGLLLLGARLGDLLARRRVFVVGLLVFVGASFLIGVAPTGAWIIAARAVQGIGAAIVAPTSLSLLLACFPEGPARSRAVTAYAATAGIGASLGLLVGGAALLHHPAPPGRPRHVRDPGRPRVRADDRRQLRRRPRHPPPGRSLRRLPHPDRGRRPHATGMALLSRAGADGSYALTVERALSGSTLLLLATLVVVCAFLRHAHRPPLRP